MYNNVCYLAVKPCGCAIGAVVDESWGTDQTQEAVTRWKRMGFHIEKVIPEEAMRRIVRCDYTDSPNHGKCEHGV